MKKTDITTFMAEHSGLTKADSEKALEALTQSIIGALERSEEVNLPGIGKFTVVTRAARTGRNPKTGEVVEIPAKKVPHCKASKTLKDAVNT